MKFQMITLMPVIFSTVARGSGSGGFGASAAPLPYANCRTVADCPVALYKNLVHTPAGLPRLPLEDSWACREGTCYFSEAYSIVVIENNTPTCTDDSVCLPKWSCQHNPKSPLSGGRCQAPPTLTGSCKTESDCMEGWKCVKEMCWRSIDADYTKPTKPDHVALGVAIVNSHTDQTGYGASCNQNGQKCKSGLTCRNNLCLAGISSLRSQESEPCGLGPEKQLYVCEQGLTCQQNYQGTFAQGTCRRDSRVRVFAGAGMSCEYQACKPGLYCNYYMALPTCYEDVQIIVEEGKACNGVWGSTANAGNHLCKLGLTCVGYTKDGIDGVCRDVWNPVAKKKTLGSF